MPTSARKEIVLEGEVGVYHVWTRCVRRAFLCGQDRLTGRDYEHRRDWIRAYLPLLCGQFGVEAGFHVEMQNHVHLVLRTRPDVVETWNDVDVVRRYKTINRLIRSQDGKTIEPVSEAEILLELAQPGRIDQLRKNLCSVSQFMKALCEHIARRANQEDQVSGTFFESRFQCRRIENAAGILICGMYIDLNQIRAGEALTPETSTHTSAFDRICGWQARRQGGRTQEAARQDAAVDGWLCELTLDERSGAYRGADPSASGQRASDKGLLPIPLEEYLQLLDWTGRQMAEGKQGSIPRNLSPIFQRLGINCQMWLELVTQFDTLFGRVVGQAQQVVDSAARAGRRWYRGRKACADAFG
jgi:hypothetical protein